MQFQISRNGQIYGPYTLEDLQRYLASGNVLPSDLAKSEEMPDWVPVSQILAGQTGAPSAAPVPGIPYQPVGGAPRYPAPAYAAPNPVLGSSSYPDPPGLSWGIYTLLTVLTCTFFSKVFTVVQAAWLKRVQPTSNALLSYGIQYALLILELVLRHHGRTVMVYGSHVTVSHDSPIAGLCGLLYLVMIFVSRFIMRASLEEHFNTAEPIGLRLDAVMTFFFGGIYFQYHLNKINALKQAARTGQFPPSAY